MDRYERAEQALASSLRAYSIDRDDLAAAARRVLDGTAVRGSRVEHDRKDEILKLAREGLSYIQIAERTGVPKSTCYNLAKEHGISRGGAHNVAVKWNDEQRATLRGLFNAKMSAAMIAKRFGVTSVAVTKELHRLGLKRKNGQRVVRMAGKQN